jgi:UDP-N-acetylmuramate: L-alanyl-gamma-D-glutamyl-meso-diaminopimelate ligase
MKDGAPGCRLGGEGKPFVLEGDEYDTAFFDKHSKFLHYAPQVCVLTHLEWDHVDIFPHFEDMVAEFEALVKLLPPHGKIIYCGDHDVLKRLVSDAPCPTMSYGFEDHNDVVLHAVERVDGIQQLTVQFRDQEVCIRTKLMGRIYYLNLVGAWCAAHWGEEMGHDELQRELGDFAGARRRLEVIREDDRVLISDFAHHPTSVQETISIVKENWPDLKLIAIFDPRNATSRRKIFEDRLVEALALADEVHLAPPPLDKRLDESERLDVVELSHRIGKKAFGYESGEDFVEAVLKASSPECVVLVMSCGSCYGCIQRLWKHESLS